MLDISILHQVVTSMKTILHYLNLLEKCLVKQFMRYVDSSLPVLYNISYIATKQESETL